MLKGDVTGRLECLLSQAREELNELLEKKDQKGISWVLGDSGKKYFTVPTLVKTLRNIFGLDLTLKPKKIEDIENYVHVEYGLYFRDSISDKYIELSCGSSRKPKNLKAGDIVGTNTIECAETAAIGRCLKFFFGVNSDLANDEEIKYSKGLSNNLTVIETLEKRRKDVPVKN